MSSLASKKSLKSTLHRTAWPLVRELVIKGRVFYQVDPRPRGKRETFASLTKAKTRADQIAKDRKQYGTEGEYAPMTSRVALAELEEMVAGYGRTIRDAIDAARRVFEEEKQLAASVPMDQALDEWLEQKERLYRLGKLRPRTIESLRPISREFKTFFGHLNVRAMEPKLIADYEEGQTTAPRTILTKRAKLSEFFHFCLLHEYRQDNPVKKLHDLRPISADKKPPVILSVAEAKKLMECAQASDDARLMVPYFAIALFAGLRPSSELERLDWQQIDFTPRPDHPNGRIEVLNTNKTAAERWVPISDNLKAWLNLYSKKKGPLLRPRKAYEKVKIAAGYALQGEKGKRWVEDITRHSFASYWLGVNQSKERLVIIHGSDLATVERYYLKPLPIEVAQSYWRLAP